MHTQSNSECGESRRGIGVDNDGDGARSFGPSETRGNKGRIIGREQRGIEQRLGAPRGRPRMPKM